MKTNLQTVRPKHSLKSVPPHLTIDVLIKARYGSELRKMTPPQLDAALITARTELAYEKSRHPQDKRAIAFLETIVKMILGEELSRKFGGGIHPDCFEKKVG